MESALNGPEDWLLRYIKTCLYFLLIKTNPLLHKGVNIAFRIELFKLHHAVSHMFELSRLNWIEMMWFW